MLSKINSGAVVGLDAIPVVVEIDIATQGLPNFFLVGLADKAVDESKERVRSAIKNSGADFPAKRITVNLAPADLPKAGPSYDVPIALGILYASEQIPGKPPENAVFLGELSLDGTVRHTNGILPLVIMAQQYGASEIYVPASDAKEAAVIEGVAVYPVTSLKNLVYHLSNTESIKKQEKIQFKSKSTYLSQHDMSDIVGQEQAKRALEIAMAGGHNIFFRGLPGSGKTMLARTSPTILPPITESEAIEVTKIYSITGNLPQDSSLITDRPFRCPHHTTSQIGLIGGGKNPLPGEISLAHRGILFLDEFPEFPRYVLEALRQPLEDGIVTISRAAGTVTYPAKFLLIAAANPCPCGNYGSDLKPCICTMTERLRYSRRISGPILDRIDLHVSVPSVSLDKLTLISSNSAETSESVRSRVVRARERQYVRFKNENIKTNSEMNTKLVKKFCQLEQTTQEFMKQAARKYTLSARSYYRVIKISRTIADLCDSDEIEFAHVAEALMYRPTDIQ